MRSKDAQLRVILGFIFLALVVFFVLPAWPQATTAAGSIQGTVTDQTGAVIPNAKVIITSLDTGQQITRETTSGGVFNSGPLNPGPYRVRVEAAKFQNLEVKLQVAVGVVTTANAKLTVGSESQTIEVTAGTVQVNTEQNTVQGVLTSQEIANLPVNGRNFLDLAQLEPGVQIQDGGNFDPTKNGFSSISFGGRAGRTARITVDGIDVSDETVGTTTQNLSASVIGEFQVSQSSLDISTGLTSSGSVNVVTKSGTNDIHGSGFYNFRDKSAWMANFPGGQDNYFQRNQFGGNIGGPFMKNKLFWFLSAERVKQSTLIPLQPTAPFADIPGGYSSPFKDTTMFGRLDYNGPKDMRFFYRINYNWNDDIAAYGSTYQPFANRNNTPSQGVGWDWAAGKFTHQVRYGYMKFQNHIADAVLSGGVYDPTDVPVAMRIGSASTKYRFGPSRLAPQATFQQNNEIKYDGSYNFGSHLLRYGFGYNAIRGGGFASFYQWPELRSSSIGASAQAFAADGPYEGGASNPLNYQVTQVVLGNGQGYATELAAFNYPAGGQYDNRIQFYIGDTWKVKSNLTLIFGVRYNRDTGRTDSDLAAITCDQIPVVGTLDQLSPDQIPCTGNQLLMDQFGGPYGGRVNNPNLNFGPQFGFSWDPWKNGKTSIRGGIGMYYENAVFNNVLFDRPVRLTKGLFNITPTICPNGELTLPTGTITSFTYNGAPFELSNLCGAGTRIGDMAPVVEALAAYYQAETLAGGPQANAGFVGAGLTSYVGSMLAPNYKTPYSVQMNLGIQRELWKDTVFSADFLRNVGLHYLLAWDTNHVGDVRYFNKAAAQAAIAATLTACGVGTIDQAINSCPGLGYDPGTGATMEDFASFGLGSGADVGGGLPASLAKIPGGYAFGGINPLVGQNGMLFPGGRSTYTALQLKLKTQKKDPFRGFTNFNGQFAYSWSRFNTMAADQDFVSAALDYANPGRYYGPNALDRTHQFTFGATFDVKRGPQFSIIGHFMSPLAVTPILVNNLGYGEIFYTDLTGDGTGGDIVTGANIGSFGRDFSGSEINNIINNFNSNQAGQLTPAGQVLVDSGLMTLAQMQALGATISALPNAPTDQASLGWLKVFDFKLAYPIKLGERVTLYPSVAVYNLFNFVNYDSSTAPGAIMYGDMDGGEGAINGTPKGSQSHPRAGLGTGVNSSGSPRQTEFGLRITF